MAYLSDNPKTKKAAKELLKENGSLDYFQPGPFYADAPQEGSVALEGPHYPAAHTWYASATVENGRVVKIK